jgi:PPOX class probable FMN-dependent enzyme
MPDDAAPGTTADTAVADKETLRDVVGEPLPIVVDKEMPRLDKYCRQFIEMSPFLCLGTAGADGHIDMSPRGDPPGFVKILDDRTLLLPERQGNQRVDSMHNLMDNPNIGLIFFLPGVEETLRIRGRASITRDSALLEPLALNGKTPKLGLMIEVETVFFQCAKALIRSKLWHPETPIARTDFPRFGQITRDQRRPDAKVEDIEAMLQDNYKTKLY